MSNELIYTIIAHIRESMSIEKQDKISGKKLPNPWRRSLLPGDMSESVVRRRPVQARSRERVELILKTARDLIGERGNDAVSMREIAAEAAVPISSLYQYFPDKSALLMAIMEQYYERINGALVDIIGDVQDLESLTGALDAAQKTFIGFFHQDPALANIWAGIQADPGLVELDARDTYRNAELFTELSVRIIPGVRKSDVKPFALFFTHTLGAIVRFSLVVNEQDGRALLKEARKLIELRLQDLIETGRSRLRK